MTQDATDPNKKLQDNLWTGKVVIAVFWTGICGWLWLTMVYGMASVKPAPGSTQESMNMALGMAVTLTTGCVGSVWLLGCLVVLVIYALLRR